MARRIRSIVPYATAKVKRVANSALSYQARVIAIPGLMQYIMQTETAGTTMADSSGNGRDGTKSAGVTLNADAGVTPAMGPSPSFASAYINVYGASLAAAWTPGAGTIAIWFKRTGTWDTTNRRMLYYATATNINVVELLKPTGFSNTIRCSFRGNSATKSVDVTMSASTWQHFAMTWDIGADQMKCYLNGIQQGATQTGLTAWITSILDATKCVIGAADTSASTPWDGYLAHAVLFSRALAQPEITVLATPI